MEELSELLLQLYSLARQIPAPEFQDAALALVQPFVVFTSAVWASGRVLSDGVVHHTVHLVGDPPDRLMDYEEVKHQDLAAFEVAKSPGRALAFHAPSLYADRQYAGIREYAKRWEHQNYILASHVEKNSGLFQWVGVYRGAPDDQYNAGDCRTLELLVPHLDEALRINRVINLNQEYSAARATAIVDRFGVLHHADAGFLALMQEEWPQRTVAGLPPALSEHMNTFSGDRYVGRSIVVCMRPVRDLILLSARRKTEVDTLSPRQLGVARHVAEGLNHKEIARRLGLSPATVRNYTQAVHERLRVRTNHELATKIKAAGL